MIITIDGSAGSGKTSAAEHLAAALGFRLLNTGAMYRAVGVLLARRGIDISAVPRDEAAIAAAMAEMSFEMPPDGVIVNGEDLTPHIRKEGASRAASLVGTFPEVRAKLKAEQRRIAVGRDIVCEGRDQGTAVFPDAELKFFFTASLDARTDRRLAQLGGGDRDTIREQIRLRDDQDQSRAVDPLRCPDTAIVVDTTHLPRDAVLPLLLAEVARCRLKG